MEEEIWRDIEGFDGKYQVSNLGRVKAAKYSYTHIWFGKEKTSTRKERILKQSKDTPGYLGVGLQVSIGKQKRFLSHRLVAKAFIENPEDKQFVNHKNGIKTDNKVGNLEWCTKSENAKHSFEIGLQCNKGENNPLSKLTKEKVLEIREINIPLNESCVELAKIYGVSRTTIRDVLNGKTWTHV